MKFMVEVFTARYGLIPYIRQISYSLKVTFMWDIFLSDMAMILDLESIENISFLHCDKKFGDNINIKLLIATGISLRIDWKCYLLQLISK